MRVRGALLDVDGTLLDSNRAHAAAYAEAFAAEGIPVDAERIQPLIGMASDKLLPSLGIVKDSPTGERIARHKGEIFRERFLPTLRPCHGARDLLLIMKKHGLKLTVASSASAADLHGLLVAAGIDDLIEQSVTSSDALASKPDPDIVEAAIATSGLPRESLVMLGDTPYDVEAARRAGVAAVAVRSGGWGDRELAGADEIWEDAAELVTGYRESRFGAGG